MLHLDSLIFVLCQLKVNRVRGVFCVSSKDLSDIRMEEIDTESTGLAFSPRQEHVEKRGLGNMANITYDIKQELLEEGITNINDITSEVDQEPLGVMQRVVSNRRQILVDIGFGRKKVFVIHNGDSLFDQFHNYINSDPGFSELLRHSFPVLQEFNATFVSWVDMDTDENLQDGAVVKALFFPKRMKINEKKPGSITRDGSDCGPKNKMLCIRSGSDAQNPIPNNISIQLHETNSSKSPLSSRHSKKNISSNKIKCSVSENCTKQKEPQKLNNTDKKTSQNKNNATKSSSDIKPKISDSTNKIHEKKNNATKNSLNNELAEPFKKLPKNINNCLNSQYSNSKLKVSAANIKKEQSICIEPDIEVINVAGTSQDDIEVLYSNVSNTQPLLPISAVSAVDVIESEPECFQSSSHDKQECNNSSDVQPTSPISGSDVQNNSKEPSCLKPIIMTPQHSSPNKSNVRLEWGKNVINEKWTDTIFTDILVCEQYENENKLDLYTDQIGECFWVCLTSTGPKIIAPFGSSFKCVVLRQILDTFISFVRKEEEMNGIITLQVMRNQYPQFQNPEIKAFLEENNMLVSFWPSPVRKISPIYHVCKLMEEKVKNAPCSSKEDIISVISQVWRNDLDLKVMCKKYISMLPEIINSMVEQRGRVPSTDTIWG